MDRTFQNQLTNLIQSISVHLYLNMFHCSVLVFIKEDLLQLKTCR